MPPLLKLLSQPQHLKQHHTLPFHLLCSVSLCSPYPLVLVQSIACWPLAAILTLHFDSWHFATQLNRVQSVASMPPQIDLDDRWLRKSAPIIILQPAICSEEFCLAVYLPTHLLVPVKKGFSLDLRAPKTNDEESSDYYCFERDHFHSVLLLVPPFWLIM